MATFRLLLYESTTYVDHLATIYDMCKAADRGMVIDNVRLIEKRGGKSGEWKAAPAT